MSGFKEFVYNCMNGFNCYNVKIRLKFGHFYDCLPDNISMTDIDATVEVNGHFLFMEMKPDNGDLSIGQALYFVRLTALSDKITALILYGDAETMEISAIQRVRRGFISTKEEASLPGVKAIIKNWVKSTKNPIKTVA